MKISARCIFLFYLLGSICFAGSHKTSIPPELQNLSSAIYPSTPSYNTERFNFNKRFNIYPTAIIIPDSNASLIKVIKALRKNNLKFSIRSGGHGFEPAS